MHNGKNGEKKSWVTIARPPEAFPEGLLAGTPTRCAMSRPHWHAQVEINYVFEGRIDYRMASYETRLEQGDFCVFWGGMPHQAVQTAPQTRFVAIHLPLVHFFRLRLAAPIAEHLMDGGAVVTSSPPGVEDTAFQRIVDYMQADDPARREHGIDEILVRISRLNFEQPRLIGAVAKTATRKGGSQPHPFHNVVNICSYITSHFRGEITSADIASFIDVHPKYAMSIFKKSTGMTLNEYVTLLRLSYAQSLMLDDRLTIAAVAFESGFATLGAFNKAFKSSMHQTPSDFRRFALGKGNIAGPGVRPEIATLTATPTPGPLDG